MLGSANEIVPGHRTTIPRHGNIGSSLETGKMSCPRKSLIFGLALLFVALLVARSSLVRMYRIGGASMAPTFCIDDGIWINLVAYDLRVPFTDWVVATTGTPKPGEMVLCALPGRRHRAVKRILAVSGDTVAIVDDRLVINHQVVRYRNVEPWKFSHLDNGNNLGDAFAVEDIGDTSHIITYHSAGSPVPVLRSITVPEESYFLTGDNRGNSWDSRYPEFGCVPRSCILGRVIGKGREYELRIED
jgi:signal peptidase I